MTTWQRSCRCDPCVISRKNSLLPTLNKRICTCRSTCRIFKRCCCCEDVWQTDYVASTLHDSPPYSSRPSEYCNLVTLIPILPFNNHGSECCNSDIPCTARQPEYYNKNILELDSLGGVAGDSGCPGCDTVSLAGWHPTFRRNVVVGK